MDAEGRHWPCGMVAGRPQASPPLATTAHLLQLPGRPWRLHAAARATASRAAARPTRRRSRAAGGPWGCYRIDRNELVESEMRQPVDPSGRVPLPGVMPLSLVKTQPAAAPPRSTRRVVHPLLSGALTKQLGPRSASFQFAPPASCCPSPHGGAAWRRTSSCCV